MHGLLCTVQNIVIVLSLRHEARISNVHEPLFCIPTKKWKDLDKRVGCMCSILMGDMKTYMSYFSSFIFLY